jgi:hypothetical protein
MAEEKRPRMRPEAAKETAIIATPTALVISLPEHHQRAAQECLEKSGKVTFSIKEVSVTKLPETRLGDGVLID